MNEKDSQLRNAYEASIVCKCSSLKTQTSYVLKLVSEEQFEMGFQRRIVLEQVTNSKVTTGEDRGSLIW